MDITRMNQADASRLPHVVCQRDRFRSLLWSMYRAYPKQVKEISPVVFDELEKLINEPIE